MAIVARTDFIGGAVGAAVTAASEPIFSAKNGTVVYGPAITGTTGGSMDVATLGDMVIPFDTLTHVRVGYDFQVVSGTQTATAYFADMRGTATNRVNFALHGTTTPGKPLFRSGGTNIVGTSARTFAVGEIYHVEMEYEAGVGYKGYLWFPGNTTNTPSESYTFPSTLTADSFRLGNTNASSGLLLRFGRLRVTNGEQIRGHADEVIGGGANPDAIWATTNFTGGAIGTNVTAATEPIFSAFTGNNLTYAEGFAGATQSIQTTAAGDLTLDLQGKDRVRIGFDALRVSGTQTAGFYLAMFTGLDAGVATNRADAFIRNQNGGNLSLRRNFTYAGQSTQVWENGQWYHIEMEYQKDVGYKLYIWYPGNGTITPSETFTAADVVEADSLRFGHSGGVTGLTMRLANFRASNGGQIRTSAVVQPAAGTLNLALNGFSAPTSFRVQVKTTGATSVRLAYSTNADYSSPTFSAAVVPDAQGYAKLDATGLAAETTYYWSVEVDGILNTSLRGRSKTMPTAGTAKSFTFGWASCFDSSTSGVFPLVTAREPNFFVMLGDYGYQYLTGGTNGNTAPSDVATVRTHRETVLSATGPRQLFAQVPFSYTYSDTDGAGANSDGTFPGFVSGAVQAAYRQQFGHPTLPMTTSGARAWTIGRVRFIQTDETTLASAKAATDNSAKTKLGTDQKTWFKDQLTAAAADSSIAYVIWLGDGPWIAPASNSGTGNGWERYNTERQEIAAHIISTGVKIMRLHGDTHTLFADDGTNNAWGGFPTASAAPLHTTANPVGWTVTGGKWPTAQTNSSRQYGICSIEDNGDSIRVTVKGYSSLNGQPEVERFSQTMEFGELPTQVFTTFYVGNTELDELWIGPELIWRKPPSTPDPEPVDPEDPTDPPALIAQTDISAYGTSVVIPHVSTVAGRALVLITHSNGNIAVTDSAQNTWVKVRDTLDNGASTQTIGQMWVALNARPVTSVTVSRAAGGTNWAAKIAEFSNVTGLKTSASAYSTTQLTTPVQVGDLVIGANFKFSQTGVPLAAPTGYTALTPVIRDTFVVSSAFGTAADNGDVGPSWGTAQAGRIVASFGTAQSGTGGGGGFDPNNTNIPGWGLPNFEDNFDYTEAGVHKIDPAKWNVRSRSDLGLLFDAAVPDASMITVDANNICHIKAEWLDAPVYGGDDPDLPRWHKTGYMDQRNLKTGDVSSAMRWGRWEVRAKVPTGPNTLGTLAAFWLRNGNSGEIDIMEAWGFGQLPNGKGQYPGGSTLTIHTQTSGTGNVKSFFRIQEELGVHTANSLPQPAPVYLDFHTWACEFTPNYFRGYYDGQMFGEWTPATKPELWNTAYWGTPNHMRVNLHVGPSVQFWGLPDPNNRGLTMNPLDYQIEHIRTWAYTP